MTKPGTKTSLRSRPAKRRAASRALPSQGDTKSSPQNCHCQNPTAPSARRSGAQAIIEAALDEFIARGFAATRLDDIAKRAGVAKGTIYLHFKDKESMFEELIRTAIVPLVGRMQGPPPAGGDGPRRDRGLCAERSSRRSRRHGAATSCG